MLRAASVVRSWVLVGFTGLSLQAAAIEFPGSYAGSIPDNNASGVNVLFSVSGLSAPVTHVSLQLALTHTWVGDLSATLTSPDGRAHLVVFSRTGALRSAGVNYGDNSNLGGVYEFADDADGDWYAAAAAVDTNGTVPPGRYRTTSAGVPTTVTALGTNHGGCSTSLKGAFGGLPAADANGVWTLNIKDLSSGDTGSIGSTLLVVRDDDMFAAAFDPRVAGSCTRTLYDYTGSGRTSFALTRAVGTDIAWTIQDNDGTTSGAVTTFNLGNPSTDFLVDGDFDGDGITDAAVWRNAAAGSAKFIVRRSSRPSPVLEIVYGQSGDDPAQTGDYDGDGISDAVVFRDVTNGGKPAHTLIHPSSGAPDRDLVTGEDDTFAIGGLDYTGDGVPDIAIQSSATLSDGRFRIYSGVDGAVVRDFIQGSPTDFVVPGNYAGDATYDVTTRRTVNGNREYTTRDMGTLVLQPVVTWGVLNDVSAVGDFDGDGIDDYAIFHPDPDLGQSAFVIRKSSDLSTLVFPMGEKNDFPPAGNRVH